MKKTNLEKLVMLQGGASVSSRSPEEVLTDLSNAGEQADSVNQIQVLTEELVQTLGQVPELTVGRIREMYIKRMGKVLSAPARFFDTALKAQLSKTEPELNTGQGSEVRFELPEPWPEAVSGTQLLSELTQILQDYVIIDEHRRTALALWIIHSYIFDDFWITPRLAITSPEKRCGKTVLMTLLKNLVARPLMVANVSPAAVFRCVEKHRPTLLIDEGDTFLHGRSELRGILNSGHQQDGSVLRTVGDDHDPKAFSTFSPCVIAMIGELPDTLEDRSVDIRMTRKKTGETVKRLRLDRLDHFKSLRRKVMRWASDRRVALEHDPEVPTELNDRAADNWRPLLEIADLVGGDWPTLARQAALEIASPSNKEDSSAGTQLLADLRTIFEHQAADRILSSDLIDELIVMEDRPWPEWKAGHPLTARQLAKILKPFGIQPKHLRFGSHTGRGYELSKLEDAFSRYLPPTIRNKCNNSIESITYGTSGSVTPGGRVTDPQEGLELGPERLVTHVTDPQGDPREEEGREVVEL